jgi:hypothetical protein
MTAMSYDTDSSMASVRSRVRAGATESPNWDDFVDFHRPYARRGALRMDRIDPGWADGIDIERLDMKIGDRCILGQRYGDFGTSLKAVIPRWAYLLWPFDCYERYGFVAHYVNERDLGYTALTAAWLEEIEARRTADVEGNADADGPSVPSAALAAWQCPGEVP